MSNIASNWPVFKEDNPFLYTFTGVSTQQGIGQSITYVHHDRLGQKIQTMDGRQTQESNLNDGSLLFYNQATKIIWSVKKCHGEVSSHILGVIKTVDSPSVRHWIY